MDARRDPAPAEEATPFPQDLTSFLLDRGTAHVKRWHNRRTVGSESVAEHHALTARIAYFVATLACDYRILWVDPNAAATAALFHDEPEVLTGDIPYFAKRRFRELREAVADIDVTAAGDLVVRAPTEVVHAYRAALLHDDLMHEIVKYADQVAALAFVRDEVKAGNSHLSAVLADCWKAAAAFDYPWLVELRQRVPALP